MLLTFLCIYVLLCICLCAGSDLGEQFGALIGITVLVDTEH